MAKPGRTFVASSKNKYRYGFNGMLKDDEVSGQGNNYFTEFRQYDSRLGRWLSIDLLESFFPGITPYRFGLNNPIVLTDKTGLLEDKWRFNSETGEYVHVDNTGGDDFQVIITDPILHENGGYVGGQTEILETSKDNMYVGPVASDHDGNWSYRIANMNVWDGVPNHYMGHYTRADLQNRYKIKMRGEPKDNFLTPAKKSYPAYPNITFYTKNYLWSYEDIVNQESLALDRRQMVWNMSELSEVTESLYGSNSAYMLSIQTQMTPTPGSSPYNAGLKALQNKAFFKSLNNRSFSPQFKPRSNKTALPFLLPAPSTILSNNPWIAFLQLNKGRFSGSNWLTKAKFIYNKNKKP